ncbi:hypothetical protein BH09BAC2_BH09BAC2_22640 [soil metagenome]
MKRILLIASAFILFSSCKRQQQALTEKEVLDVIHKFDDGWEHKNLHAVDSALASPYVYFTQSGSTFIRDSVVATAGENSYLLHDMSRTEIDVQLYGNTAIVSTRWKGKGFYRGAPFDEDQRCSITVVKRDNKVEILSEHCTPIKRNIIFH